MNTLIDTLKAEGGGGKKGRGQNPVEGENTLVTSTTAKVQFLVSRGENGGLADQTNPLKSVYFNNVPVMNADGSTNFANVIVDERYGLPSQTVMEGATAISTPYNVATEVTTATSVTYTTTTSDVDALRVTMRFPALYEYDDKGNSGPTTVNFQLQVKLTSAGSYVLFKDVTLTDKCVSPADLDYYIPRPAGAGTWQVRVTRITADNSSQKKANETFVNVVTELKNAQLSYDDHAYIGVATTAEATGVNYPTIAFAYKGRKVRVPTNYNNETRTYTGVWVGTWAATRVVSSNPIWCLLDMLTENPDGHMLDIDDIDIYSFYDAAYYCDEQVPRLVDGAVSGTEPRYSFNFQYIEQREDEWTAAQNLASVAGAILYVSGNFVKLIQDRPTAVTRVLTNSNVVNGEFIYSGSTLPGRTTACIVYWSDPDQNGVAVPAYYEDAAGVARFGYNLKEITGFGITTEGQAQRLAKWNVETALSNPTIAQFKVGLNNASIIPGEVIQIADSHFQGVVNEARAVSLGSGTITLDKAVVVASGNTLTTIGSDGTTLETRTITSTGTLSTVAYSGAALTAGAGAIVLLSTAIAPRTFKVTSVLETRTDDTIEYNVAALLYDANKFGRVDNTPTGVTPVFSADNTITSAPLNLTFQESSVNDGGVITRKLTISWTRPTNGKVDSYMLSIRRAGGAATQHELRTQTFEVMNALNGLYEIRVAGRNARGIVGAAAEGSYDLSIAGAEASAFDPVTNLEEYYDGTTIFSTDDLTFKWTNPASNADLIGTLRDFEIRVKTTGGTLLRTFYAPMVTPGSTQYAIYSYQDNVDDGGPRRSVVVEVRIRDTSNDLTDELAVTFTNPAPGIPPNLSIVTGLGSSVITYDSPGEKDYEGVLIWRSATKGFTPSIDTLIFDGVDTYVVDGGLTPATKYYYIVAAYDSFAKTYDGAGLNLSSEVGVTVVDNSGQANKARNSDFEVRVANNDGGDEFRPIGYGYYSYPYILATWQNTAGFGSNAAFSVRADEVTTGTFGLLFNTAETPDGNGSASGWTAGVDYTVSFYAKKAAGASWSNMTLAWDNPPEFSGATGVSEALLNPTLSTSFQRYAFHFKWHTGATVDTSGALYLSVLGNTAINDIITIDRLQIEIGETHSGWQPRLEELGPNSITEVMITDDSITTPKIVSGAVITDKLASNSVTTEKLVIGAVSKEKMVAIGDINQIDTKSWNQGMTMPPDGYAVDTGTGTASIVLTQHPDGRLAPTWKSTSTATDAAAKGGILLDYELTIDPTKTYRMVVWFKNSVLNTGGATYHGPGYGYEADVLIQTLAGVDEVNPYFNSTYRPDVTTDRWYASIGYIFPYDATGLSNQGGVYDGTTMQKVYNGTDYKFKATTTRLGMRAVVYGSADTSVTYFCKPRIDIVDGSEASLQEILASGGVSGFNPINTANQSVIITDGTITAPKMNVAQLSAVSANIGVLRTASSGQRVEVRDNQILVYDSSNVVRVKIGDLA